MFFGCKVALMNKTLRDSLIEIVKKRVSEGDCPLTLPLSVEMLENIIVDLSNEINVISYKSLNSSIDVLRSRTGYGRESFELAANEIENAVKKENLNEKLLRTDV